MAHIQLLDGTREEKYGKVVLQALAELANYQKVLCKPAPGSIDIDGYNLVKRIERYAQNPQRNQVDMHRVLDFARQVPGLRNPNTQKIILMEQDAYSPGLNWCFGGVMSSHKDSRLHQFFDYLVVSISRIKHSVHFFDLMAHELGHMYGAAPPGRRNTEENLGSHCINDLCVMQQHLTVPEAVQYAHRRHQARVKAYCSQCGEDLVSFAQKE